MATSLSGAIHLAESEENLVDRDSLQDEPKEEGCEEDVIEKSITGSGEKLNS